MFVSLFLKRQNWKNTKRFHKKAGKSRDLSDLHSADGQTAACELLHQRLSLPQAHAGRERQQAAQTPKHSFHGQSTPGAAEKPGLLCGQAASFQIKRKTQYSSYVLHMLSTVYFSNLQIKFQTLNKNVLGVAFHRYGGRAGSIKNKTHLNRTTTTNGTAT